MRASDIPPHLHDRYGIKPPSPWRWVAWALAALIAVPVGVYAASRYIATQSQPYALMRWASHDDGRAVDVSFRTDAYATRMWCVLRAQDFDHRDVGFAVVRIDAGVTDMEYRLATLARPTAVDVVTCGTDPYALPGPQFAPGVLPPAQVAPGVAPGFHSPEQLDALQ